MQYATDREIVISTIRSAWADAEYSPEVDAALRSHAPHPEEQEVRSLFVGKSWDQVPEDVLLALCPNPFLLGDIAFAYYLPAFLLAAIANPSSELPASLVDFYLKPPKKEKKLEGFCRRVSFLTREQRGAVATFLTFLADHRYPPGTRAVARIHDSIARFWGK